MTIEWDKIINKPNKGYKILGQRLLDLRLKIENNKQNISSLTNIRDELTEKLGSFTKKISDLKSEIMKKDEKITSLEENLKNLNVTNEEEINSLRKEIKKLKEEFPKKHIYEEAEEVIKGPGCPKCGWTTLEEYKIVDGRKKLIRKYCPNTFCLWSSAEGSGINIAMDTEIPEEIEKDIRLFQIRGTELEEITALNSNIVAIISEPVQETVWIWRGKDSSRFEYAEATRQAAIVKNEIMKKTRAHVIRVNEDEEPENFPKF